MKKSTCKKTVKEKATAKVTKKKEQEIGKEYKWNLSDIIKNGEKIIKKSKNRLKSWFHTKEN